MENQVKSKIIIVDENDDVIGHKERGTLKQEDVYRVSALWIVNSSGDILLARRAFSKSHDPGKWGPAVAGTVDEGEDYDTNIIKEAEEELGLKAINPKKIYKERVRGRYNHFTQWYLLNLDRALSDFEINEEEVAEIRWFSKNKLLQQIHDHPDRFLAKMKQWVDIIRYKKP